jgi:uncharacterized membrane protein YsdA (DUF1294 family)
VSLSFVGKITKGGAVATKLPNTPHLFYALLAAGGVGVLTALSRMISANLSFTESLLLGINGSALLCMGLDKYLARASSIRIPESIIFVLSLLGGVPGTLLGLNIFGHKTRKASFQFMLLLIAAVQCGIVALLGR